MTTQQRIALMAEWWPNACRDQGWNPNDRALRIRVLGQAVGRELTSASELNNREDVDRVKAYLTSLSDSLKGAREVDHPEDGRARRLRRIVLDQVKCLALYLNPNHNYLPSLPCSEISNSKFEVTPEGRRAAESYVRQIIRDKFRRAGAEPQPFDDLPFRAILDSVDASPRHVRRPPCHELRQIPSNLDQLVMTVARALHNKKTGYRVRAGHTMHTMLTLAGLECPCTQCCKDRRSSGARPSPAAATSKTQVVPQSENVPF